MNLFKWKSFLMTKTNVSFNINSRINAELCIYYEKNKASYEDIDEFLSQMLDLGLSRKIQLDHKQEGLYFDDEEYTSQIEPSRFISKSHITKPESPPDINLKKINQNSSEDKQ